MGTRVSRRQRRASGRSLGRSGPGPARSRRAFACSGILPRAKQAKTLSRPRPESHPITNERRADLSYWLTRLGDLAIKVTARRLGNVMNASFSGSYAARALLSCCSLLLAETILRQHHFPPYDPATPTLLRRTGRAIDRCRVLELGSGTGVLAVLLHALVSQWTASDQFDNLKLIQRNVRQNGVATEGVVGQVEVEEVDWVACERDMDAGKTGGTLTGEEGRASDYDLVLAVDCIYNEALTRPLARTLTRYTTPGRTACLVVAELRSSDVVSLHEANSARTSARALLIMVRLCRMSCR